MKKLLTLSAICLFALFSSVTAEEPDTGDSNILTPEKPLTKAEMLVRLKQLTEEDTKRLKDLESQNKAFERKTDGVSDQFNSLEKRKTELNELKDKKIAEIDPEGKNTDEENLPLDSPTMVELATIEGAWVFVRDELDYFLQLKQTADKQIEIVKQKIEQQGEAFDFITQGETSDSQPEDKDTPDTETSEPTTEAPATGVVENEKNYDSRVAEATRQFEKEQQDVERTEKSLLLIQKLLSLNQDDLVLAQAMSTVTTNEKDDVAAQRTELQTKLDALNEASTLDKTQRLQVSVYQQQLAEIKDLQERIATISETDATLEDSLNTRIETLKSILNPIEADLRSAESDLEDLHRKIEFLESPFAPHRLLRWLYDTGPKILSTVIGVTIVWFAAKFLGQRFARRLVRRSKNLKDGQVKRIETLYKTFENTVSLLIIVVGILLILPNFGVDLRVLLGGAAIFSVAIAFGAQTLVKDYFTGFMVLIENQYRIGDVVKINDVTATVEEISLRMTTLRDFEGGTHFMAHGNVMSVRNLTNGWAQVVLNISVAYKENIDEVMTVLLDLAKELKADPDFSRMIVGEPQMLGVNEMADSAVIVRFMIKTKPQQQWTIKREMLRRIKIKFDELGIEIPFSQRALWIRNEGEGKIG